MLAPYITENSVKVAAELNSICERFDGTTVLITGALGFLGQYFLQMRKLDRKLYSERVSKRNLMVTHNIVVNADEALFAMGDSTNQHPEAFFIIQNK